MKTFAKIIRGAAIVDGSGAQRYFADVGISGNRIARIGDLSNEVADEIIDAAGLVLAPGFIDVHSHDDRAVCSTPDMTPKISQGVTTVIVGNCGFSLSPVVFDRAPPPPFNALGGRNDYVFPSVGDYISAIEEAPAAVNVAILVGHSTLRAASMGCLDRPATEEEICTMVDALNRALSDGAIGMSTGLAYPTASAAPTSEVISLTHSLSQHGGIYVTHMRDESDAIMEAIDESVKIGMDCNVPVVISHHKCCGPQNHGRTEETLAAIRKAQEDMTLDLDCYPYIASSTVLLASMLKDSKEVLVSWSEPHPDLSGRSLASIAQEWSCSEEDALNRLSPGGATYFQVSEEDLERVMSFPGSMIGSDGLPHDQQPHPRLWGTFPRVLGRYCRDRGLFSLEEAVNKMTGKSASVFGLVGRGVIAVGSFADIVLFNPDEVLDRGNFDNPRVPAQGIELVLVNGQTVWQDCCWTGSRPGMVLKRTSTRT